MTHPRPLWPWPPDDPRRFMRIVPSRLIPTGRDAGGRKLCAWCPAPIPPGRRRYCSEECSAQADYRMATWGVEKIVAQRDRGRCSKCGRLVSKRYLHDLIRAVVAKGRLSPLITTAEFERRVRGALELQWRMAVPRLPPYELDHVTPVSEGGGGCGPDGFRLLCRRPCHAEETGALRRRLNARKRAERQPCLPVDLEASR